MGGVGTIDPWLLDLAQRNDQCCIPAYNLAVMQETISRSLGHIVALNDPFVRRWIAKAAPKGKLPAMSIRCLRCGCVATLTDWITCSRLPSWTRLQEVHTLRQSRGVVPAAFMTYCCGEQSASRTMEALKAYAEEKL